MGRKAKEPIIHVKITYGEWDKETVQKVAEEAAAEMLAKLKNPPILSQEEINAFRQ